jgi:2-dehydropantoate 2-reductase
MTSNILLYGTGGVGCIYAYILHSSGAKVTTVCRSNYDAVSQSGISIQSALHNKTFSFKPTSVVRTVEEAKTKGPFDYIVICSKNFPGEAVRIKEAVSPETAIVLCQNGIGIEPEYTETYPNNSIISGVVYLPTTQTAPGTVKWGPLQLLHIGTFPATAPPEAKHKARTYADMFERGGGVIRYHEDVQRERWIKLAVNVAWNPICALSRLDDANFLRSSALAEPLIRALMVEVGAVASAAGYAGVVTEGIIDAQMERPRKRLETGGKEPSMLTDVREGRNLEVEAILGNAVRIARREGVATDRLDVVYALAMGLGFGIVKGDGWKDIA